MVLFQELQVLYLVMTNGTELPSPLPSLRGLSLLRSLAITQMVGKYEPGTCLSLGLQVLPGLCPQRGGKYSMPEFETCP